MTEEQERRLQFALEKLNNLEKVLERFQGQITSIRQEISSIQSVTDIQSEKLQPEPQIQETVVEEPTLEKEESFFKEFAQTEKITESKEQVIPEEEKINNSEEEILEKVEVQTKNTQSQTSGSSLEDFIGGNLLSKVGILMLLIGVGIFVKYAVDMGWLGEIGRVLLAYAVGGILIGLAYWSRSKYTQYSAVLFAGGVATVYFTTYLGNVFYDFPIQGIAFPLMVLITGYTVWEATRYNQQSIGIFGLVGAYVIPILLSKGGGNVAIFFSYITLINIGVLILASRKKWNAMNLVAFLFSWIIYLVWLNEGYEVGQLSDAIVFASIFFLTFYSVFVINKLTAEEDYAEFKVFLNSIIFYGVGFSILNGLADSPYDFEEFLQIKNGRLAFFTLGNAIIHGIAAIVINQRQKNYPSLALIAWGLSITFITLTIPIYFEASWVTLFWAAEAVILLGVGKKLNVSLFKNAALVLIVLSTLSLLNRWGVNYFDQTIDFKTIANPIFLTSIFVLLAYGGLTVIEQLIPEKKKELTDNSSLFILVILVLTYLLFALEINHSFATQYYQVSTQNDGTRDTSLIYFRIIWLLIYSAFYFSLIAVLSFQFLKKQVFYVVSFLSNFGYLFFFLALGLTMLSFLRGNYIDFMLEPDKTPFETTSFHLSIRYILYLATAILMAYQAFVLEKGKKEFNNFGKAYSVVANIIILVVLSYELNHWYLMTHLESKEALEVARSNAWKIGFTLLWGIYSGFLIGFGIWRKRRALRFVGFGIFFITLIKLFFVDISYITTLSKILVFISVAVIFLGTSFLYQKYKHIILAPDED